MAGIAFISVGRKKTGKTTLAKGFLESKPPDMPVMVYDINNEYKEYYPEPFEDFDVFLKKIANEEVRHTYILIEEATIFFNTHSNFYEMKNILVRARHTRNIIQLNFHSFSSIPKGIYNLIDFINVFKTNDTEKNVKDRFDNPKVLEAYFEVLKSDNPFYYKTVNLY